jgi:signal peptidase II
MTDMPLAEASVLAIPATDSRKWRWLLLSLAILVADQWSKWLVELHLPQHASRALIDGFLSLTHVRNTGVAFGLFASGGEVVGTMVLAGLGCLALAVVGYYFRHTPATNRLLLCALALVVGGAIGNLCDRIASGAVTDFVDVYWRSNHWPAFNVADSAITIGLVLMALDALWPGRNPMRTAAEAPDEK